MHTGAGIGHGIDVLQLFLQVIGVEYCALRRLRNPLCSQAQDIGVCLYHHQEISPETANRPDGLSRGFKTVRPIFPSHRRLSRQEGSQKFLAAYRPAPRTAASVGCGEGLVEIEVNHVKTHISGTNDPHHRIQVRPVIVAEAACAVDDAGDFQDIFIKKPYCIGIGEHQARRVFPGCLPQLLQIHAAVRSGGDIDHRKPGHGRAGRVRAVG